MPTLALACIAGDLAVGEEACEGHITKHFADGIQLAHVVHAKKLAATDAVEDERAGTRASLQVCFGLFGRAPCSIDEACLVAVEDADDCALRDGRRTGEGSIGADAERCAGESKLIEELHAKLVLKKESPGGICVQLHTTLLRVGLVDLECGLVIDLVHDVACRLGDRHPR